MSKEKDKSRSTQIKSIVLIVLAAICWGTIGLFSRTLSDAGASPVQVTAIRCVVVAVLLTGWLVVTDRERLRVRWRDLWMFFGTGICSILFFNVCYFYTQTHTSLAIASILLYTSPFFVMLISAVVFRERLTAGKIIALLIAFCGCVLITGVLGGKSEVSALAILSGIGSGLGYGLYSIFGKLALRRYDIFTVTAYTFIFAAVGSVPFSHPVRVFEIISHEPSLIVTALMLGVLCTLVPFVLYTIGLNGIESGKASVVAYAEPAVATIVGVVAFNEPVTPEKLAGILMVLVAIIILARKQNTVTASNREEDTT